MSGHQEATKLTVISLGAGHQSSVMSLLAADGVIEPMPDAAIFADTQWEPPDVYENLDWLKQVLPFPVYRVTAGDIRADVLGGKEGKRFAAVPFYTSGGGMGRRQCTREYKIEPINRKIRELLGVGKGQRVPKGTTVTKWIGISVDEASRMKPAHEPWAEHRWPLVDLAMTRSNCVRWFQEHYPGRTLPRSACVGCPYHDDNEWRRLRDHHPESFAEAVEFDRQIRDGGSLKGMHEKQYLHQSLMPLGEVDLRTAEDRGQENMFENECAGYCGV